jgi:hypothetical protein
MVGSPAPTPASGRAPRRAVEEGGGLMLKPRNRTGAQIVRRRIADIGPMGGVVGGRDQGVDRDVGEGRVAVVAFAVGEGAFQGLGDEMHDLRPDRVHGAEVVALQHSQHLQEHRPLAP